MPTAEPIDYTKVARVIATCVLVGLIAAALAVLFLTPTGELIRSDPREVGRRIHDWVHMHWILWPLLFILAYLTLTMLMLPVWWLQVMSGYVSGLVAGIFWSQLAATLAAICAFSFSRWLAADWFHKHFESKMVKIRRLDNKLGHNGFLIVMAIRLAHVLPFAASNYAMGLTTITAADIAAGTFLGGLPAIALYVTLGIGPHLLRDWRYTAAMVALNVLLLIPVVARYLRPQWFKRIGIE